MSTDSAAGITIEAEASNSGASTSAARSAPITCEVCGLQLSKYVCPRCETRICSLGCTQQHKRDTQCDGVREKTEYVPMNAYNDISMWRDLAFLREIGDKVKDWGGALNLPSQESINKKERQLAGNRKGKQREDSGKNTVVHDRLKSLSKREINLRRSLMQNGIEILFLPKEMERHKANKSSFNLNKKKLTLTVSVHNVDESKKRMATKVSHDHTLETKLLDIIKKAYPGLDLAKHVILLPVPVRPVVYSKNAPFPEAKKATPSFIPPMQIPKPKPLPRAHSSLPMKPAWLGDVQHEQPAVPAPVEPEIVPEKVVKRELPKASAREVWLVNVADTLKDALKGTSILEWPEFELWPEEAAREEVEAERLEYVERRKVFDRDDWKRKREAEQEQEDNSEGEDTHTMKRSGGRNGEADDGSGSDSSSSLSSTSDDDSDSSEDMDGEVMSTPEKPLVKVKAEANAETPVLTTSSTAPDTKQEEIEVKGEDKL